MENIEEEINPDKQESNRNPDGTFKLGFSGNPKGRPIGQTLKEWARNKLMSMSDEEREEFIKSLPKEIIWRMSEGNPHQSTDMKHDLSDNIIELIKNANEPTNPELSEENKE